MKVAIVGLAPSTRHLAPFDEDGWETWGLLWDPANWHRMDRLFEMHDRALLEMPESGRSAEHWVRLKEVIDWGPVYMQQAWPDIPRSVEYPFDAVRRSVFAGFPRSTWAECPQADWYSCSLAYMLALALYEGARTIGLWGVDVRNGGEHAYERPCLEYLIGLAVGRGVEVVVPEGPTALGVFQGEGSSLGTMKPSYPKRYGSTKA